MPEVTGILYGVKPVILAIIFQALWGLGRTAVKTPFLGCVALLTAVLNFGGVDELLMLLLGGTLAVARRSVASDWRDHVRTVTIVLLLSGAAAALIFLIPHLVRTGKIEFSLQALFLYFLKGAPFFTAAVTCCWRFCSRTWWVTGSGSRPHSSWMPPP